MTKRGRPPTPDYLKQRHTVMVRFTDEEWEILNFIAELSGQPKTHILKGLFMSWAQLLKPKKKP
jgi:hypothetical protein